MDLKEEFFKKEEARKQAENYLQSEYGERPMSMEMILADQLRRIKQLEISLKGVEIDNTRGSDPIKRRRKEKG